MNKLDIQRRHFLKYALLAAVALPMTGYLVACTKKEGGGDLPEGQKALDENDATANALGYKHSAAAVDTAKFPKKAAQDGASQKCSNCAQYNSVNAAWGRCNIFPQGLVAAEGWCNSWVLKAS